MFWESVKSFAIDGNVSTDAKTVQLLSYCFFDEKSICPTHLSDIRFNDLSHGKGRICVDSAKEEEIGQKGTIFVIG